MLRRKVTHCAALNYSDVPSSTTDHTSLPSLSLLVFAPALLFVSRHSRSNSTIVHTENLPVSGLATSSMKILPSPPKPCQTQPLVTGHIPKLPSQDPKAWNWRCVTQTQKTHHILQPLTQEKRQNANVTKMLSKSKLKATSSAPIRTLQYKSELPPTHNPAFTSTLDPAIASPSSHPALCCELCCYRFTGQLSDPVCSAQADRLVRRVMGIIVAAVLGSRCMAISSPATPRSPSQPMLPTMTQVSFQIQNRSFRSAGSRVKRETYRSPSLRSQLARGVALGGILAI